MKLIEALLYEQATPKALIMGGGAGSGKTSLVGKVVGGDGYTDIADRLIEKGWKYFNPDKYARDPESKMYKNLSAASVLNREEVDNAIKKDRPNLVWDTTANNVAETLKVPEAGYDTLMLMMYTHPMVSIFNNFARASKEGEESLPVHTVLSTWIASYKTDTIDAYRKALGDRFFLVNNPGGAKKQADYEKLIREFDKAIAQGTEALTTYFERLSDDPFFRTSMSKGTPELPAELQADYDQKIKDLGLKITPEEDKKLKREALKYYTDKGEFLPAEKKGAQYGYLEKLNKFRINDEKFEAKKKQVVQDVYNLLKGPAQSMISRDEAIAKAKAFLG